MHDPLRRKVQAIRHRKKQKPLSEEIRSMYKLLSVTLTILGLASIFSYLYINSLKPAKGYHLKQLQLDYEELQSDQRDLERKIIESQSFINMEEEETILEMEPAERDEFSYVEDSAYAQN